MAIGPKWNKRRGTWYVQFWDGRWRRKDVARAPRKWKPGDPEPRQMPPEAHAGYLYWSEVEKKARAMTLDRMPVSLRGFLEEHVASYLNPQTRASARDTIEDFLAWCASRQISRFDQVGRDVCREWLDHVAVTPRAKTGKPFSLSTIRTRHGYLASAWGRLLRREKIKVNPWVNQEIRGEDRAKPRGAWTRDQFDRLMAESEDWLREILIFGVQTGLRIGAIMRIEWEHWVRPEPGESHFGYLHVPAHLDKVKEGYKVPVSRELYELLIARETTTRSRFIMTGVRGKPLYGRSQTAKAIVSAARRARLPIPTSPNHHMRRTFGRWAVLGLLTGEPVPLYVVSRWMGHLNVATTLKYLDIEDAQSIRFMVPDLDRAGPASPGDSSTPPAATPASS